MTYHKDFLKTDQRFRREDFPAYSEALQKLILEVIGGFTIEGGKNPADVSGPDSTGPTDK
jgi:hypothetical protein